jgi:hypothetical protein
LLEPAFGSARSARSHPWLTGRCATSIYNRWPPSR